jgi:hypothetical protein
MTTLLELKQLLVVAECAKLYKGESMLKIVFEQKNNWFILEQKLQKVCDIEKLVEKHKETFDFYTILFDNKVVINKQQTKEKE